MVRYFCRVEYKGTSYSGWQIQKNNVSIQSALETAFSTVIRIPCKITGAGRTDSGVHARGQGMHIDLVQIPTQKIKGFEKSINAILPSDIAIYNLEKVKPTFHARFSALERIYKYYIITRKQPLWDNKALLATYPIDWNKVHENIDSLRGKHDFSTFCAAGSSTYTNICMVNEVKLETKNDKLFIFTIQANRFIYKMVRSLVGTLLDIGSGKINNTMETILSSKKRSMAGQTASPCGLVLDYVTYDEVE